MTTKKLILPDSGSEDKVYGVDWNNLIDDFVGVKAKAHENTLDHTHPNKSLIDTYIQTEVDVADAISKKHSNSLDHSNNLDHSNSLDHPNTNDPTSNQKAALEGTSGTPSSTNKYVTDSDSRLIGGETLPAGLIAMWHGLIANVPDGWLICDGDNGTPDLRSKFVRGATAGFEAGGTGGETTYSHAGCIVEQHPALTHGGTAVANHPALSHGGTAVANHVFTQPNAHANHVFTQPTSHPATATSVADVGATKIGSTTSTATLKAHTHNTPVLTHSGGTVDAHSAHSGGAVDTHQVTQPSDHASQTHSVTQPSDHAAMSHSVTQADDHTAVQPPYYDVIFIMKT